MKKVLLLISILLAATTGVFAQKSASYGLCEREINGVGVERANVWYEAVIEVPEEVAQQYKGTDLTAIEFGFNSGLNKVINIFVTYDLAEKPVYVEEVRAKVSKFNYCELETPFPVDGRRFFVGYKYHSTSSQYFPVAFDGVTEGANPLFNRLAMWEGNEEDRASFANYPQYGNLCLNAYFSGDKDVKMAQPSRLIFPSAVGVGQEFTYSMRVRNFSTEPITEATVYMEIGDDLPVEKTVTLAEPIPAGEFGNIEIPGSTEIESLNIEVKGKLIKVNGVENPLKDVEVIGTLVCSDDVYPRINVVEEFTGVDCGWCPRGIVGLEELKKNHPDNVIVIAAHNYNYPNDPMQCASYRSWSAGSAPGATMNRTGYFDPNALTLENIFNEQSDVAFGGVKVKAVYANSEKNQLDVTITSSFAEDHRVHNYALAIVRTQDEMGPFSQANNYANGKGGALPGWDDDETGYKLTMYNDVAREIVGYSGLQNSIPTRIEKGEKYEYKHTLSIDPYDAATPVAGSQTVKLYADHPNTWIVALLIDRSTGYIMNADRCRIEEAAENPNKPNTGVAAVDVADVQVYGEVGAIRIAGDFDTAEVYGIDGSRHAVVNEADIVALAPGLYIVKTVVAGKTYSAKVVVR